MTLPHHDAQAEPYELFGLTDALLRADRPVGTLLDLTPPANPAPAPKPTRPGPGRPLGKPMGRHPL